MLVAALRCVVLYCVWSFGMVHQLWSAHRGLLPSGMWTTYLPTWLVKTEPPTTCPTPGSIICLCPSLGELCYAFVVCKSAACLCILDPEASVLCCGGACCHVVHQYAACGGSLVLCCCSKSHLDKCGSRGIGGCCSIRLHAAVHDSRQTHALLCITEDSLLGGLMPFIRGFD
jgi:hypothetical protein